MESDARLFYCVACRAPRVICRRCDRGQRYCGRECAHAARRRSLRAAGARYQRTTAGRFGHAARQRRYRDRMQKVTHQGSAAAADPLSSWPPDALRDTRPVVAASEASQASPMPSASATACDFCGRQCAPWLRRSWVRSATGVRFIARRTRRASG
jgi:hypothetical protein